MATSRLKLLPCGLLAIELWLLCTTVERSTNLLFVGFRQIACHRMRKPLATSVKAEPERVERGSRVGIEYSCKLEDGTEIENTEGKEPLVFVVGEDRMIP